MPETSDATGGADQQAQMEAEYQRQLEEQQAAQMEQMVQAAFESIITSQVMNSVNEMAKEFDDEGGVSA